MNLPSIAVLCLGSVTLCVGIYHLTFFIRTRSNRENLFFAGMCLSIFLYDFFCAALYSSSNISAGAVNQKWQSISLTLLSIFSLRFTSTFINRKKSHWDYVFITYWVFQITAMLFDKHNLTWTDKADIKEVSFFNLMDLTYYEVKPGILILLQSIVGLFASAYIIGSLIRHYLEGHKRRTRPIIIGIVFLVLGVLYDSAITAGIHQGVYMLEYSYMFLILAMAYSIADTHLYALNYLRDSEEKYRRLVQNVPDIMFTLDINGSFTSINERGIELLGYRQDELIDQHFSKVVHPKDIPTLNRRFKDAVSKKRLRPPQMRFRMTSKGGETFWMSLNSSITYDKKGDFIQEQGIARDITAIKTTEEELVRLGAAVESAEESIIITDKEGNIVYVNPRFEKMTGYSREEITGQSTGVLSGDTHDETFYTDLWETIRKGQPWHGHFTNRKKDGTLFEEEATISPIFGPNGKIINYVAVKRDVTQQMALEGQLRHSQKMEAIGQLAGKIAHDFTNALVIIMGNAQLAEAKLPKDSDIIPHLTDITKAANKVSDMTGEMLAFAHKAKVSIKNKDINRIVQSVEDMLKASLSVGISLTVHTNKKPIITKIDPSQIEQILVHLSVNASDAVEEHGNMTLEVSREIFVGSELRQIEDIFNVDNSVPVNFAVITVSDNGPGMTEDVRKHIFEPFYTTKHSQSTGLGLSTVLGIIKRHEGCITVSSELGVGTTFKIFLPVTEPQTHCSEHEDTSLRTFGENKSVLIVDKDTNASALLSGMFARMGYKTTTKDNAGSAITFMKESNTQPDVVVVEISSTDTNGKKAVQYCNSMAKTPMMILTSPHGKEHLKVTSVINDSDIFLPKPFSFCNLANILTSDN